MKARELFYIFGEKDNIAFIFFVGKITRQSTGVLQECALELKSKSHKAVVLVFRDVTAIAADAFNELGQFQSSIRQSGKALVLSSLIPKLKSDLLFPGVIRDADSFNNLQDALNALRGIVSTRI